MICDFPMTMHKNGRGQYTKIGFCEACGSVQWDLEKGDEHFAGFVPGGKATLNRLFPREDNIGDD